MDPPPPKKKKKKLDEHYKMSSGCCQAQFSLKAHGIITFDTNFIQFILSSFIRLDIILIVCSHKILLYIKNCLFVIKRNHLNKVSTNLELISIKNSATNLSSMGSG